MLFGPIKFQWFGVLICMGEDQSGARGGDFSLYKSALLWQWGGTQFPIAWKTEDCISPAEVKTWVTSGWSRAKQMEVEQGGERSRVAGTAPDKCGTEQRCLAREAIRQALFGSRAVPQLSCNPFEPLHSHGILQLCCTIIELFALVAFFTTPQAGLSVGTELGPVTTDCHPPKEVQTLVVQRNMVLSTELDCAPHWMRCKGFFSRGFPLPLVLPLTMATQGCLSCFFASVCEILHH